MPPPPPSPSNHPATTAIHPAAPATLPPGYSYDQLLLQCQRIQQLCDALVDLVQQRYTSNTTAATSNKRIKTEHLTEEERRHTKPLESTVVQYIDCYGSTLHVEGRGYELVSDCVARITSSYEPTHFKSLVTVNKNVLSQQAGNCTQCGRSTQRNNTPNSRPRTLDASELIQPIAKFASRHSLTSCFPTIAIHCLDATLASSLPLDVRLRRFSINNVYTMLSVSDLMVQVRHQLRDYYGWETLTFDSATPARATLRRNDGTKYASIAPLLQQQTVVSSELYKPNTVLYIKLIHRQLRSTPRNAAAADNSDVQIREPLRVCIKFTDTARDSLWLDCEDTDTAAVVKQRIQQRYSDLGVQLQRLSYDSELLEDDSHTLAYYGVENGAIIQHVQAIGQAERQYIYHSRKNSNLDTLRATADGIQHINALNTFITAVPIAVVLQRQPTADLEQLLVSGRSLVANVYECVNNRTVVGHDKKGRSWLGDDASNANDDEIIMGSPVKLRQQLKRQRVYRNHARQAMAQMASAAHDDDNASSSPTEQPSPGIIDDTSAPGFYRAFTAPASADGKSTSGSRSSAASPLVSAVSAPAVPITKHIYRVQSEHDTSSTEKQVSEQQRRTDAIKQRKYRFSTSCSQVLPNPVDLISPTNGNSAAKRRLLGDEVVQEAVDLTISPLKPQKVA